MESYDRGERSADRNGMIRLLTTREAADILHVHPNTLRKWSNSGLVKAYRLGGRGDRRFDHETISRLLTGNIEPPIGS